MPRHGGFVEREEGTYYGRVLRNLGHMNMLVYCNDGKQRICHIRGAMRRRMWVNIGDIVLASSREYELGMNTKVGEEKGDIVHKYEASDHARLKADRGFNQALLLRLEQQADLSKLTTFVAGGGGGGAGAGAGANAAYQFHDGEDEEDEKEGEEGDKEGEEKHRSKGDKCKTEEARRQAGLQRKMEGPGDDDIDIDAI